MFNFVKQRLTGGYPLFLFVLSYFIFATLLPYASSFFLARSCITFFYSFFESFLLHVLLVIVFFYLFIYLYFCVIFAKLLSAHPDTWTRDARSQPFYLLLYSNLENETSHFHIPVLVHFLRTNTTTTEKQNLVDNQTQIITELLTYHFRFRCWAGGWYRVSRAYESRRSSQTRKDCLRLLAGKRPEMVMWRFLRKVWNPGIKTEHKQGNKHLGKSHFNFLINCLFEGAKASGL